MHDAKHRCASTVCIGLKLRRSLLCRVLISITLRRKRMVAQVFQDDVLLTFKEAMTYLRVSRSTLYRLMWSGQLTGHKVGSTWRFYREDLRACVGREISLVGTQAGIA